MAFFRKKQPASDVHPITGFWQWWQTEGHGIDPRRASAMTDRLSGHLERIHPDLSWHFGKGAAAEHCLTVSAGGIAELRPTAERWLRAAPAPDATWEFRSSQAADPGALDQTLQIGGAELDLALTRFRVEVDDAQQRVHVGVYHPAYLAAALPEDLRGQIMFLVLDWLLGEDDVERWLGHVETLTAPPGNGVTGAELREQVAELARRRDPQAWAAAEFTGANGAPGLAIFRSGVRWIDHPTFDRHQLVTVPYAAQANGLPRDDATLQHLRGLEEELDALLGRRGILIGHESQQGTRQIHAYTDGQDQNVDAALAAWAGSRSLSVQAHPDPSWRTVRHLTG